MSLERSARANIGNIFPGKRKHLGFPPSLPSVLAQQTSYFWKGHSPVRVMSAGHLSSRPLSSDELLNPTSAGALIPAGINEILKTKHSARAWRSTGVGKGQFLSLPVPHCLPAAPMLVSQTAYPQLQMAHRFYESEKFRIRSSHESRVGSGLKTYTEQSQARRITTNFSNILRDLIPAYLIRCIRDLRLCDQSPPNLVA